MPQGVTITNATLQLKCTAVHGTPTGKMVFYRILQDWDQTTITDKSSPGYTSQDSVVVDWPKSGEWLSIDVTKIVQYWYDHPESNFGIMGHCAGATMPGTGAIEFNNMYYGNSNQRPILNVSYTTPNRCRNKRTKSSFPI